MPFIETKTTVKLTEGDKKALTEYFGKAIEIIPGKSEEWLMLSFEGGKDMAFRGSFDDCAILEVKLFGCAKKGEYEKLTEKLCDIMNSVCKIKKDRIYVKYDEIENWGYNGFNF